MQENPDHSRPPIALDVRPRKTHTARDLMLFGAAGVVLVILLALVGRSHAKREDARKAAALQGIWGALQGCVLGNTLEASESPSSRFRNIQLTVLGLRRDPRGNDKEPAWPMRCASYASSIVSHADAAPSNGVEVQTSMAALAKEMSADTRATADLGKLIERSWKDAKAAGLDAKPANPASCPKPATVLLTGEAMSEPSGLAGDFPLASIRTEPVPTRNVRFLIADPALAEGPVSCSASGTPTTLVCAHVGDAVAADAPGLSLLGTTEPGAHPWIFAGDRGQLGVFRPSGTIALHGEPVFGASVGADDSAWLLVHPRGSSPTDLQLVRAPLIGDATRGETILGGNEVGSLDDVTLMGSWILLRAGPRASFASHLVAHAVSTTGLVGPAVDIGDAASITPPSETDGVPRFSGCRSGANIVVRLHGARADAMTFFTGEIWTAPVALATRGGTLACDGNEAIVTSVTSPDGGPVVEQSRCSASGCMASHVVMQDLLADTDVMPNGRWGFAAAALGRKLLIVWNAGPLGGIRMRLATPDTLNVTPDIVVVDTKQANGEGTVTDVRILPAASSAIVVLKTTRGVRLADIDIAGKVKMLHTQT
jgi:hypothetical protein